MTGMLQAIPLIHEYLQSCSSTWCPRPIDKCRFAPLPEWAAVNGTSMFRCWTITYNGNAAGMPSEAKAAYSSPNENRYEQPVRDGAISSYKRARGQPIVHSALPAPSAPNSPTKMTRPSPVISPDAAITATSRESSPLTSISGTEDGHTETDCDQSFDHPRDGTSNSSLSSLHDDDDKSEYSDDQPLGLHTVQHIDSLTVVSRSRYQYNLR